VCGIAGYVGPSPPGRERVEQTLALMRHRGPDDQTARHWTTADGRSVALLHSRLSIIDLGPQANQPFRRGSRWLAFNGELYNYLEVRKRLLARGVCFETASDTEVLSAAIEADGWEALDGCEGMWAFALYDEATEVLTLGRDRFGEKPLWLLRDDDGGLTFGSEPKFLFALSGRRPAIDRGHLARFLVNGYKSLHKTRASFFEGLEALEPGALLHVCAGEERQARYWSPPEVREREMSFEDAVAGTRERLIRSVELRLRADVPLAFLMSGGVDSLSLISIARRMLDYSVHGFTIVNRDERYEEQAMVDHAVADLGIAHTPVELDTAGFLPKLRDLVRAHDAPVATITYYVHSLLMEHIHASGYRVSVSGTAADELFSGYYDHHLAYLADIRDQPELHDRSELAWREHVAPVVRNPYLSDPELFVRSPGFRDHIYLGADEFAGYLRFPFEESFSERRFPDAGILRTRMLNELFAEAVPVILNEDDLNAMKHSIENRSPFLDRELFEFSLTVPTRHLVRDGRAKAVLREAMRGIAPDRAMDNRRKVGFNAPIRALLDVDDPEVRRTLLEDSPLFELIHRDKFEALLDRDYLPNSASKLLFNLVNTKFFLDEYAA
jgi:asparagine synthase (glutamine-hydrolysing)